MMEDFELGETEKHWHLDKRIPVAIIFAIFIQTAGVIWWGATTSERLANLERRVDSTSTQADRLTRVEVKIDNITDALNDIRLSIRRP